MAESKKRNGAHLLLAGLFISYFVAGTVLNVVVPLGEAPDEPAHFAYVRYVALNRSLPTMQPKVKDNATVEAFQAPAYYVLAAWLTPPLMQEEIRLLHNPAFDFGKQLPAYLPHPEHTFPWRGTALAWHWVRFFSLTLGAISLWSTYRASLLLFEQLWLALASVAYLALNPQFIYLHSMVTNDTLATAAASLLVWATLSLLKRTSLSRFFWVACSIWLTALSKPSALILAIGPGVVALIVWKRLPSLRVKVTAISMLILIPLLGSGWWFLRNQQLYGDVLGLTNVKLALAANYYPTPLTTRQFITLLPAMLRETFESSWGKFGWVSIPLSSITFSCILAAHFAALTGLCLRLKNRPHWQWHTIVLGFTWLASIGGFLYYNRVTNISGWQGRFLFPSLSITAMGFVEGWRQWFKHRGAMFAKFTFVGGIALVLYALIAIVLPTYLPPRFLPAGITVPNPTDVEFASGLHLVGYKMTSDRVIPGGVQHLTLYWKLSQPIQPNYHFAVDSYTPLGDPIVHKVDSTLTGRYPLNFWPTNQIVADKYRLPVDTKANQMAGALGVQVYSGYKDQQRPVPFIDGDGNTIGNRIEIDKVIVSKRSIVSRTETEALAKFGLGEILLVDYQLSPEPFKPRETFSVTLHWRATRMLSEDYQIFVHLLDEEGNLVAQHDSPPREGRYPTSAWTIHETIIDTHPVSLPTTNSSHLQLCVGLYSLSSLERLPTTDAEPSVCSERSVAIEIIELNKP